jgi:N-hydroxyarylamine O-acetyltransferase
VTDLDAYFGRIGYDGPREPTLKTLRTLHERHPAAIPFEAFDVVMGKGVDLSAEVVDRKLIEAGRGGYCFEQNGLFRRVLQQLGFELEPLIARVLWRAPPDAAPPPRTHMALRVLLDGERWLVDVGFGGRVMTEPLRYDVEGPQPTRHDAFRLVPLPRGRRLEVELETGWAAAYEVSDEPAVDMDYVAANWFTSTHPASRFRSGLMVARTTPEARFTLADERLTVRTATGETRVERLDAAGLERVLQEVFGLRFDPAWRPALARFAAVSDGI